MDVTGGAVLQVDGNGYVQAANSDDIQLGNPYTIAMWIKTSQKGVKLLGKGHGDHNWEMLEKALYIDGTGGQMKFSSRSTGLISGTTDVADGRWHHVAVTYDGSTTPGNQEIYVDGVNDTATRTYLGGPDNGQVFRLGWSETRDGKGYQEYVGLMDEVYLYGHSLDAAGIADLYEFGQAVLALRNTNLLVSGPSTLHLQTSRGNTLLGDLTLDAGVALKVTGGAAQFHHLAAGNGSSIEGDLRLGGTLSSVDGPGTLSVIGTLEMGQGSTYQWQLGASSADLVDVSGKLTLSATGWPVKLVDSGAVIPGGDLPLFSYGSLADDSLGAYAVDTSDVPHWIFVGGSALLLNDAVGHRVVLTGLSGTSEWGLGRHPAG